MEKIEGKSSIQPLGAFHNDPQIKAKYLTRVRAHIKADELAYETELGIPVMLAVLEGRIFERAPMKWSKTWPERFLEAIEPGADLSKVGWKFQHWLLLDPENGTIRFAREEDKPVFHRIGSLLSDLALGKTIDRIAAESAASLAESAARSAERNEAWNAGSATWSAAWSAESSAWLPDRRAASAERSAENAACSAADVGWISDSAAWSAARNAAYQRQGEKLLELLREAD